MQETIQAGTELWKIGGIAAVLLGIIVFGGWLNFRFFVKMVQDLHKRLNEVQDRQVAELSAVVTENTASNREVIATCRELRTSNAQVVDVLRSRPCLIETGPHHIPRPSLHHAALIGACFLMFGCTQVQVDRAERAVVHAREILLKAEAAEAQAVAAVQVAKDMAAQIGGEKAQQIVDQAERAFSEISAGVNAAHLAVTGAEQAVQAAKSAQAAGGNTWDILLGAVAAFVPTAGGLIAVISNSLKKGRALRQTVSGVEAAREALGEDVWKARVAPALRSAQDESVRKMIAQAQVGA